ncbi:hypothetical protein GCM10010207_86310 [Streptomyces atratus]|nr:hypothetical protein GCM10010207_86310 [Streptomyces atratus]
MLEVVGQPGFGGLCTWSITPVMTSPGPSETAGGDELGGGAEQAEAKPWVPSGWFGGRGEHGHPGEEAECDEDDLEPDQIRCGVVQGQVTKAGVAGVSDAALATGPPSVTQLKVGEPAAFGVGCEGGGEDGAGLKFTPCSAVLDDLGYVLEFKEGHFLKPVARPLRSLGRFGVPVGAGRDEVQGAAQESGPAAEVVIDQSGRHPAPLR